MDLELKSIQGIRLTTVLLSSLVMVSCAAAPRNGANPSAQSLAIPPSQSTSEQLMETANADLAQQSLKNTAMSIPQARVPVPQQKTQLIKTAALGLRVQSVTQAVQSVTQAATLYGGDILRLQDQIPQNDKTPHTATLQLRVPQAQLDQTLEALSKLGTVETRSIQAEDVASQLVDFDARLKNLRKSEEVVLGIMDRSGSVGDVLKVSQTLSQIRDEIEQIQGQVHHLRQQVAYSTLSLTLTEPIAKGQQGIPVGDRLQETWSQSTRAMGDTTTNLLRLGLWLLVFSPYLLIPVILTMGVRQGLTHRRSSARIPAQATDSDTPAN